MPGRRFVTDVDMELIFGENGKASSSTKDVLGPVAQAEKWTDDRLTSANFKRAYASFRNGDWLRFDSQQAENVRTLIRRVRSADLSKVPQQT